MKQLAVIFIIAFLLIPLSSCGNSENNRKNITALNENIITERGFSVKTDSTEMNTSAKGTIFIKGAQGMPEQVQIIACIEIDPNDWGGVTFYIPNNWRISNIISSYPENETQVNPDDYVTTWTSAETEPEWSAMLEIGRGRNYIPTGGGIGTVVIDLTLDKDTTPKPTSFNIMVAVGSDEKDGVRIKDLDHISIEIPIT